jgi:pSer/pThr/pTyr-binding forkhead associated (FHA) protein
MTKEESLDFLELPRNASVLEIASRFKEKYNFFKMLHTNAPNPIIRNLQQKNLEILEEIKIELSIGLGTNAEQNGSSSQFQNERKSNSIKNEPQSNQTAAWIIVHTEEKSTKSYPLFEGINAIGRISHPKYHSIELSEDSYVSRIHCFIILEKIGFASNATIADDGKFNEGKKSMNGTYVNGKNQRIISRMIKEGDTIQIGMTKFVFKWNSKNIKDLENSVAESNFEKTVVINL